MMLAQLLMTQVTHMTRVMGHERASVAGGKVCQGGATI